MPQYYQEFGHSQAVLISALPLTSFMFHKYTWFYSLVPRLLFKLRHKRAVNEKVASVGLKLLHVAGKLLSQEHGDYGGPFNRELHGFGLSLWQPRSIQTQNAEPAAK